MSWTRMLSVPWHFLIYQTSGNFVIHLPQVDDTLAIFWCLFPAHVVSETMTHLNGKWYQQKQNKNEFWFWELWRWWPYSCCFSIDIVKKIQKKSNLNEGDGTKQHVPSSAGFWQQRNLASEKYDRLTSFWCQSTGTRNGHQELASVSSL